MNKRCPVSKRTQKSLKRYFKKCHAFLRNVPKNILTSLKYEMKWLFSTLKFWQEKMICDLFFTSEKTRKSTIHFKISVPNVIFFTWMQEKTRDLVIIFLYLFEKWLYSTMTQFIISKVNTKAFVTNLWALE